MIYNFDEAYPKFKQLLKAVEEFRTYIVNNGHLIPNYGERYRNSEAIAAGFVESTVNQVVSKRFCEHQQMHMRAERLTAKLLHSRRPRRWVCTMDTTQRSRIETSGTYQALYRYDAQGRATAVEQKSQP